MIRRLLKINLKGTNNKAHIIILAILSMMITYIKLSILDMPHSQLFCMGDILIWTFGGLSPKFDIINNFQSFTVWIIPNIILIYLVNSCIIHKSRETTILILPRAKKKLDWLVASNITIGIIVIKYYLILFISSLLTIFMKMGVRAFVNTNVIMNNYNNLTVDTNQYLIMGYIFLLNVLATICLVYFINNIYYVFFNSNHASIIGMIICFITVITTKFNKINKLVLMNQGMIIRHDLFKGGFQGFNLSFSILYLCIFLTINFILNITIIRKRDITDI